MHVGAVFAAVFPNQTPAPLLLTFAEPDVLNAVLVADDDFLEKIRHRTHIR